MNLDGQALAGVRNRVGKWQLISELHQIDREKKAEMRMHNTAKQRFKAKYYKLEYYIDRGKEASDVRMYETHNPGFCYRRNGECRIPQVASPSPSVDFKDIYSLLFTDGEVDIEKVLCLHLLTAHRTETLTPPTKPSRSPSFIAKDQTPLERLIERSRRKRHEDSISKLLPTYVLDVNANKHGEEKDSDVVIRDGRLAARVIINDKIVQLIHTVMAALQHTNPDKLNDLLKMASDAEAIKSTVEKPHIQKFLYALNGNTLVCSCESFHLTQPFKATTIPLQLETSTTKLAQLVNHIRRNVLQLPAQSTWKNMYTRAQSSGEESATDIPSTSKNNNISKEDSSTSSLDISVKTENADVLPSTSKKTFNKNQEPVGQPKSISSPPPTHRSKRTSSKIPVSKKPNVETINQALPKFMSYLNEDEDKKQHVNRNASGVNFKNQAGGSKSNKNFDREKNSSSSSSESTSATVSVKEKLSTSSTDLFRNTDMEAVTSMFSNRALAAHKRDQEQLNEYPDESEKDSNTASKSAPNPAKVSIKQTTCSACMQKWKTPLPHPKTPNFKKALFPTLESYNDFKIGNAQRLSMLIDEETKKLHSEGKRHPRKNLSKIPLSRSYKNKGHFHERQLTDVVDLDILDLAKISQEIKEKETQKKLNKFLSHKI